MLQNNFSLFQTIAQTCHLELALLVIHDRDLPSLRDILADIRDHDLQPRVEVKEDALTGNIN